MHFKTALALLATSASAKTVKVMVGQGGLKFSPETIMADKGDMLEFHFKGVHSVVQGDYEKGCAPVDDGGFYSGTINMGDNKVMVNSTDPMFLYCSVAKHCQNGMVAAVNPTKDMTLSKYMDVTGDADENMSPPKVYGGTVKDSGMSGGGSMSSGMMSGSMTGSATMMPTGSDMMSGTMMPTGTDASGTMMPTGTDASGSMMPTSSNAASNAHVGALAAAAGIAAFIV